MKLNNPLDLDCPPKYRRSLYSLLASSLIFPFVLQASLTTIFAPDFSGSYEGSGDQQFNYVGSAEDGAFAALSVEDGWFQMTTQHQVDSLVNQSATRLSRHGGSTSANALAFEENFGVIQMSYSYLPTVGWAAEERSILNITVGQNFRPGAFNPARGGVQADGPAFANLSLRARDSAGVFRFIAGGGPGSSNFTIIPDGAGRYHLNVQAVFNNSSSSRIIELPTGEHTIAAGCISIWVNGSLVWDNYDNNNLNKSAQLQHVSFGLGNGTIADYNTAQVFAGVYRLKDIKVQTVFEANGEPIPDPVAPEAPSALVATRLDHQRISLTWQDNSQNENGFRIEGSIGESEVFIFRSNAAANATSFVDTGLSAETTYSYRIRAENAVGFSGWTNIAQAETAESPGGTDPNPAADLPFGYLSVIDFGADPTGVTDSTEAIQTAINEARDNNRVLWFPGGVYTVSDRLEVDQPDNNASFPGVLMGSTVDPMNRSRIRLAPNSPGFNDPNNRRVVLHYFNRGTADNEGGTTDLYSQAIVGIDFEIGEGNNGAVALRMQGAEGCTIEDVLIDLTQGGHTGIWGIPGSGGATHGVTIIGGVYGIDTRTRSLAGGGSQPSPVVTGSNFINQSERAVFATARGSLVMVGCHFERSTPGPIIRMQGNWAGQPFDGSFQLIDCSIEYNSYASINTVIDFSGSGRSFYFDNVYIRNARRVLLPDAPANSSGWTHFNRLAIHQQPASRGWGQPAEPVYINGLLHGDIFVDSTDDVAPPVDLLSRHRFPTDFPTWESPGIVNVHDLGAVGDGVTDNWEVLQQAIDNYEVIFLPVGSYAVSRTLKLKADSKIIGSHPTFTDIRAISTVANRFNGLADGDPDAPIIQSADLANADTILAFFQIRRIFPLAQHNPTPPGNFALEWRSGGNSLLRQLKVESRTSTNFRPDFAAINFYGINTVENPIDTFHPQQSFPDGMWAWPNDHPNVLITGNGGGRWFTFWFHGRQGLRENTPFLLVKNTREPLHMYHVHLQQQDSRNHAEFINAHNVSVYNTKGELKGSLLYFEDCDNVRVFGNGGLTSPDPSYNPPFLIRFINSNNFLISGQSDTINEGETRWIGGIYDRWIHANIREFSILQDFAEGREEIILPYQHRPILYLRGEPSYVASSEVTPQPVDLRVGATLMGNGYYELPWFGVFAVLDSGYLYHLEHGWLNTANSTSSDDLRLWHSLAGWIHTSEEYYPYLFSYELEAWMYYQQGGNPRSQQFYNFKNEEWVLLESQ